MKAKSRAQQSTDTWQLFPPYCPPVSFHPIMHQYKGHEGAALNAALAAVVDAHMHAV